MEVPTNDVDASTITTTLFKQHSGLVFAVVFPMLSVGLGLVSWAAEVQRQAYSKKFQVD